MGIEILLKLLLASVLGGLIGLDREIAHKGSGLRVNVSVAVGCTLLTVIATVIAQNPQNPDLSASPVLAHLVTAIGLMGAAVIIGERRSINGITSATLLFIVGAVGIAVGLGHYLSAFAVAVFTAALQQALKFITAMLDKQSKLQVYVIKTDDRAGVFMDIKKVVIELGLKYIHANMSKIPQGYEIQMTLNTSENKNKDFIERIMQLSDVKEINSESL